jgi:small-conductance mechanosensitive channel
MLQGAISPWFKGAIVSAAWILGLIVVMRIVYARLKSLSRQTRTEVDDIVLKALSTPLIIIILMSGGLILSKFLPLSEGWDHGLNLAVKIAFILASALFVDRLVKAGLGHYSSKLDYVAASSGIVRTAVRAVILLLAALSILGTLGVSITPLIASLGVGSLAIALALQPLLSNFFSGLEIVADKPVTVGQYVKLSSGEEGYVTRIGWRSTTVRAIGNNLMVVPNSKMADAIITNYDLPASEQSLIVQVGVHYHSDLDQVERVTCEVAKEVLRTVEGGRKDFEPFIRYHTFGEYTVNFSVILRVDDFVKTYAVRHEFIKRLHRRYRQEGIVIPFPIRTLDLKREDLLLLKERHASSGP